MSNQRILLVAVLGAMAGSVFGAASATVPAPQSGAAWMARHEAFVAERTKGPIDVLFLGDSITDFWRDPARGGPVWEKNFGAMKAANFGISADRTQHLLWRIENGEVDGISPKIVVLLIGTNNIGVESDLKTSRNTPAEAIAGVTKIVQTLRTKLPQSRILLIGLLPRADEKSPWPAQIAEVNAGLVKLADGRSVRYLDLGPSVVDAKGAVTPEIMPDLLHLNAKGYEIWADALRAPIAEALDGR